MAIITDYAGLQAQIILHAGGSGDSQFADGVRMAIARAEADMNNSLRVAEMMVRSIETVDEKWESLPPGFIALRAAWLVQDPDDEDKDIPLRRRVAPDTVAWAGSNLRGCPQMIFISGGQYRIEPREPDTEYQVRLLYYRRVPDLSEENPCTAILTRYPSLYLNGSLANLDAWLHGDPRLGVWQNKFHAEIAAANIAHSKRIGGGA